VNVFLWGATALLLLELPLVVYVALAPARVDVLPTLQTGGSLFTLALVMLAQGFHRSAYTILGVVAAVLTFAGTMVFVRFFERELDS
jgi:multisubunit Na+/H+ antiporter MnhF subunit